MHPDIRLPSTGTESASTVLIAGIVVAVGAALLVLARRRQPLA